MSDTNTAATTTATKPHIEDGAGGMGTRQLSNPDDSILERIVGQADYTERAEAIAEEMWQEMSDDMSYFDRLESLEYWDDEDEMYENMADQYEVKLAGKGNMLRGKASGGGPKQGKAKRADAKTAAIKAAGGVVEGKGRGREEVEVPADDEAVATKSTNTAASSQPASQMTSANKTQYPMPNGRAEDASHLFNPRLILQIVKDLDARNALITKNQEYSKVVPTDIPLQDLKALVAGYDHMMNTLHLPRYKKKYGGSRLADIDLRFGDSVPNYFANVGGESMYQRKAYSIAGLRNLLQSGASIYSELSALHFFYPKAIQGPLARMRHETGNVVDLDTVVLRASSSTTINMINASNKAKGGGLPIYNSTHEFGDSEQAKEMAIHLATVALNGFKAALKLSDAQLKARAGHPSQIDEKKPLPSAHDNSTRGHVPLWRYQNCGQDSFHANCPELEDVVGALLRAPLHCVYHYAYLFSGVYGPWANGQPVRDATADREEGDNNNGEDDPYAIADDDDVETMKRKMAASAKRKSRDGQRSNELSSTVPDALKIKLDAFFEDCVADSCFNRKWRSIEEFGEMLKHEGTMTHVLQLLQMRHQKELMAFYDQLDAEEEGEGEGVEGGVTQQKDGTSAPAPSAEAAIVATTPATPTATATPPKRNKLLVVSRVHVPPPAGEEESSSSPTAALPLNSSAIAEAPKMAKEIDFIYGLVVAAGGLKGRDEVTGNERFITRGDVAAVVRAAAGV